MYDKPGNEENFTEINASPPVTGTYAKDWGSMDSVERKKYLIENNDELYYYPGRGDPNAQGFLNWGAALFKNKYGRSPKVNEEFEEAASLTYNTVMHVYLRCTTKSVFLCIKTDADPENPPNITITPDMSQNSVIKLMEDNNYITVFSSYGDFGSNNDTTYSYQFNEWLYQAGMANAVSPSRDCTKDNDCEGANQVCQFGKCAAWDGVKGTNWHQNMMFVWSVITQKNNSGRFTNTNADFWKHLTSYMSDISIRGGGNYKKAMAPEGVTDPNLIKYITQGYDGTSYSAYKSSKLANFANVQNPDVLSCQNILTR